MTIVKKYTLKDYLNTSTLANQSVTQGLFFLANMINYASDKKDASMAKQAIKLAEEFEIRKELTSENRSILYSYMINAWSVIKTHPFSWEDETLGKQIYYGRKALLEEHFSKLPIAVRLSSYTNLGNALVHTGRILDAIEYYNKALTYDKNFGMALGAKARAISIYANLVSHGNIDLLLYLHAEELYRQAIDSPSTQKHALKIFKSNLGEITKYLDKRGRTIKPEDYNFCRSEISQENSYQIWCLLNGLILNPINSVSGYKNIRDIIHTPSIYSGIGKIPPYYAYFNQLKQEFLAARFLCFEGSENLYKKHYSDKYGYLLNTYDSALWDYHTQQIKLAFLTAYSVLDKIAMYIDDYFNLHQPTDKINFRNVWYQNCDMKYDAKKGKHPILRKEFVNKPNLALLALYWLSKDFQIDHTTFAIEPEAERLRKIRNSLEHRFFQIRLIQDNSNLDKEIGEQSFCEKSIKLLQLVHHALIYLACAVIIEEERKQENAPQPPSDKISVLMEIEEWTLC